MDDGLWEKIAPKKQGLTISTQLQCYSHLDKKIGDL